jgi:hypothetical protein
MPAEVYAYQCRRLRLVCCFERGNVSPEESRLLGVYIVVNSSSNYLSISLSMFPDLKSYTRNSLHTVRGHMASMKSANSLFRLHAVHTHALPASLSIRPGNGVAEYTTTAARGTATASTARQLTSPRTCVVIRRPLSTLSVSRNGGVESDTILSMPPYPNANQVKFIVTMVHGCQTQSRLIQIILDRLGAIVSTEWTDGQNGHATRTPLRVLSAVRHPRGQSMIAFTVFNASFIQRDAIVESLQELSDISYCGYEEGTSSEWLQ